MLDAVLFEYPVLHLKLLFIGYERFNLNVDVMFKVFVKGHLFECRCMFFLKIDRNHSSNPNLKT